MVIILTTSSIAHRASPVKYGTGYCGDTKRLVHCTGVVVRCLRVPVTAVHGRYRAALFFTDVSRADHRAIAEYVLDSMFTSAARRPRP